MGSKVGLAMILGGLAALGAFSVVGLIFTDDAPFFIVLVYLVVWVIGAVIGGAVTLINSQLDFSKGTNSRGP